VIYCPSGGAIEGSSCAVRDAAINFDLGAGLSAGRGRRGIGSDRNDNLNTLEMRKSRDV
jgi:hypothetical protein